MAVMVTQAAVLFQRDITHTVQGSDSIVIDTVMKEVKVEMVVRMLVMTRIPTSTQVKLNLELILIKMENTVIMLE